MAPGLRKNDSRGDFCGRLRGETMGTHYHAYYRDEYGRHAEITAESMDDVLDYLGEKYDLPLRVREDMCTYRYSVLPSGRQVWLDVTECDEGCAAS
jgi:hypothetical protein